MAGVLQHAVVAGAGIGGLATAVALRRSGWRVTVLERSVGWGEVGAGITMFENALRALDELGAGTAARRAGLRLRAGGVRKPYGSWLLRIPEGDAESGVSFCALHRADLHRILRKVLGPEHVITGAEVRAVRSEDESARVSYERNGSEQELVADLVVGADGVRSTVRGCLHPRYPGPVARGYVAWRGVAEFPGREDRVEVTWGRDDEFGIVALGDEQVYWFATCPSAARAERGDHREDVLQRFGSWHAPIGDLVRASGDPVLRHEVVDLSTPLPRMACGRVALLGDAAHAATPDMGQGAAMALEDAVVLGAELVEQDVPSALENYDRQRRPRNERIVRRSRWAGRITHSGSRWVSTARDVVLRSVPARAAARAAVTRWEPPRLPSG